MAFQYFYGKKLTVLVVSLLLVFSSFTFLPAFAYPGGAVTNAVKNSPSATQVPPTVSGNPSVIVGGGTGSAFGVTVTNPSTNPYAVTSLTVVLPTGWTFPNTAPTCGSLLKTAGAFSTGAEQCTGNLPPGFTDTLTLQTLTGPTSISTSPAIQGTFTTLVVDSSSGSPSYAGNSFTEYSIASTSVTVTPSTAVSFTAGGSPITVTATLSSGQTGIPIVWSTTGTYPSSGFTDSLSPSSGVTTASGASTTFTPSNHAGDATTVVATLGSGSGISGPSATITTQAGAPTQVSFYFSSPNNYPQDYLTASTTVGTGTTLYAETASEVSLALADQFANPVAWSTIDTQPNFNITLTGVGGQFLSGTTLFSTISCGTVVAGKSHFSCSGLAGNTLTQPFQYLQSSVYGAVGEIAGSITVSTQTYTGTSANIVTSTLGTLGATGPSTATNVKAGSSILVQDQLSVAQAGVPVTLNLCTSAGCSTSAGYHGVFSNGLASITLTTNSTGGVESLMPVNTTANSIAQFNATALAPTNAVPTTVINSAGLSALVTTIPGTITTFVVNVAAGTGLHPGPNLQYVVPSATAYIDLAYADAYNNLVTAAPSNQIQIALQASAGTLSATQVYITGGDLSTNATTPYQGFGPIQWNLPSTVGTVANLTATGNVNGVPVIGHASLMIVSASPTLAVSSPVPLSGTAYSSTAFVTFKGTANATLGSASTNIVSIGYKVGTGAWQSLSTATQHNVVWTVPIVLASGLNTVTFNTTDSVGVTTALAPLTVLVDSAAPTFGNLTVCECQTAAAVNVTDSLGDLNASSVQAWVNGTAVSASSISISGTNNPGSSVSYTVTIDGLTTGAWSVKISASDLAGNTATTTQTIVIQVPPGSTFSFPTPTAGMLGPYHVANVSVTSHSTTTQTVVVFAVVMNSAGQTVQISTSTITVAAGATVSAYPVINVPSGTYTVQLFVWSTSGSSLSQTGTMTVTY